MARPPKLRKKKGGKSVYWFTKAGGDIYLGNVEDVPYPEARKHFNEHLQSIVEAAQNGKRTGLTAGELMDLFLDWVEKNRSERTCSTRKTYCSRFAALALVQNKVSK